MEINNNKIRQAWDSLKTDDERGSVKEGNFPHTICYFELNFAEHKELQRIAKRYFREKKFIKKYSAFGETL